MLRELTSDDHVHHHHHDAEDEAVEVVSEKVMAISSDNINDAKLKELSNALVVPRFEVSLSICSPVHRYVHAPHHAHRHDHPYDDQLD